MAEATPNTTPMTGRCMCGACDFAAVPTTLESGACHCEMCRKWAGGVFMAVSATDVVFSDAAPLKVYDSSDWGERVFCSTCGSTLVWQTKDGAHKSVSAAAFDNPNAFPLTSEIFIDRKPDAFAFVGDHARLTKADVMAKYAPDAGA